MKRNGYIIGMAVFMVGVFVLVFIGEVGRLKKELRNGTSATGSYSETVEQNNDAMSATLENISVGTSVKEYYKPLNFQTQKAMWFTAMDYEKILLGKTQDEFTQNIQKRFQNAKDIGINTVYVHVRLHGDAYYNSELFPAGGCMSETTNYDPLQIMVDIAHSMGLSIHAWINPLRCQTVSQMEGISDKYKTKQWVNDTEKNGTFIINLDGRYYLNPAYEEVRTLIADGAKEIVEKYNVDGIHIDDYFYPTTDESFDQKAFAESGSSDLSQWRLDNSSKMVAAMYQEIKEGNPEVLFGISPQGSIDMDYKSQYADVKKWTSEKGYCDYIVPQLYYGFKNELCPYKETVDEWKSIVTEPSVKLVIGVCTYKIGVEDSWAGSGAKEWVTDQNIPSRQIAYLDDFKDLGGVALYSYASTFEAEDTTQQAVMAEVSEIKKELNK